MSKKVVQFQNGINSEKRSQEKGSIPEWNSRELLFIVEWFNSLVESKLVFVQGPQGHLRLRENTTEEKERRARRSILGKGGWNSTKSAVLWVKKWFNSRIGNIPKNIHKDLVQFQNRIPDKFYSKSAPNYSESVLRCWRWHGSSVYSWHVVCRAQRRLSSHVGRE